MIFTCILLHLLLRKNDNKMCWAHKIPLSQKAFNVHFTTLELVKEHNHIFTVVTHTHIYFPVLPSLSLIPFCYAVASKIGHLAIYLIAFGLFVKHRNICKQNRMVY